MFNSDFERREFRGGYYSNLLGLTGNADTDVDILYKFYVDRIGDISEELHIKETLYEYANIFNLRGLNGSELIAEKISMVSRKSSDIKKNIGYLVGCFRNILENGLSTTGSSLERRLINAFESKFNIKLSPEGVTRLLRISARESTLEVLLTLTEANIDVEGMIFDSFENMLKGEKL